MAGNQPYTRAFLTDECTHRLCLASTHWPKKFSALPITSPLERMLSFVSKSPFHTTHTDIHGHASYKPAPCGTSVTSLVRSAIRRAFPWGRVQVGGRTPSRTCALSVSSHPTHSLSLSPPCLLATSFHTLDHLPGPAHSTPTGTPPHPPLPPASNKQDGLVSEHDPIQR